MNAMQLRKEDGTRFFVTIDSISAVEEIKTRKGFYAVIYIGKSKTTVMESYEYVLDKMFGIVEMANAQLRDLQSKN